MGKIITSLLFKNGFRVFGKTKVLATQLTVLTTLAATSLMTTILTNYNLDQSKHAILDQGEPFDFSIQTNLSNNSPVKVEKLDLNNIPEGSILQPKYTSHLNNVISSHSYGGNTNLTYNGVAYTTIPSYSLWTNEISDENQKLVYYFAMQPNELGQSLFMYGENNEQNLLSLINVPPELKQQIIKNTTEVFSFQSSTKNINNGVPIVKNNQMINNSTFDIRNILVDKNNEPIGQSEFGSIQITGFNILNYVNLTHNVVNTSRSNQVDFEQFKNGEGSGEVPQTFKIYLGDQNEFLNYYDSLLNNSNLFMKSSPEVRKHNITILASIGDSFNQLAKQKNAIISDTKWIPIVVSLDPSKLRGIDLFCYKLLFENSTTDSRENNFFNDLYSQINKSKFNLPEKRLNTSILKSNQDIETNIAQNDFVKYFKTILWVPQYSNATKDDEKNIKEQFKAACNTWYSKSQSFFLSIVNDENSNYIKWNSEIKSIYENLLKISSSSDVSEIYTNFLSYIKNQDFVSLDKNVLVNGIVYNKLYFNKYQLTDGSIIDYWRVKLDPILKQALGKNLNFIYTMWFTLEGLLNNFGFIYKKASDFTTQVDSKGVSYTFNKINRLADVNNIVSQTPINWDFFESRLNFDPIWFKNISFDISKLASYYVGNKQFLTWANYSWFKQKRPYDFFKIISSNIILKGEKDQNDCIVKYFTDLAKLDETKIKNEADFVNIWKPLFAESTNYFYIKNTSDDDGIFKMSIGFRLGLGGYDTVPIDGIIIDKSGLNILVSETYLSNNAYSSSNLNGKSVYKYYDSYLKVSQLPYTIVENKQANFDPTSPNWIFNHETGQYEFFKDYSSWLKSLPSKYKMNINGVELLIVGSALSPEFLYPAQNTNSLLINPKQSPVLYANNAGFSYLKSQNQLVNSSSYYAVRFPKNENAIFKKYLGIFKPFNKFNNILLTTISNNNKNIAYLSDDQNQPNQLLYVRTNFTNNVQQMLLIATSILTIILLLLSGIFICTLIRSIVKQNIKTFGIAISNGIGKAKLSLSMLPFALIPGIIAAIFGYVFATLLQPIVLNSINSFWCLPINYNYYVWWIFIIVPIIFVGLLFLIIHLVVIWTLRKNVTTLLSSSVSFRMNFLVENSKWLTRRLRPTSAFKATYMLGNITRFLTLIGIITTFISMASISVGSINAFSTSLAYTERNKNYVFGFDLISPTAQGGWYYAMPYSQIGTTQQGIQNSVHYDDNTNLAWINGGTYNGQNLMINSQLIDSDVNLRIWLKNHFSDYIYGSSSDITIPSNLIHLFVENKSINTLIATIQTFSNSDVLCLTPKSIILNNDVSNEPQSIKIINPSTITMQYISQPSIYANSAFDSAWKDYYLKDKQFTSTFYPSFNIADQFFGNIQFFKDRMFMQETLDISFDLGAMKINPWILAQSLLPTSVIQQSQKSQQETLKRIIEFFKYLDLVNNGKLKDDVINYQNYYLEMGIVTNKAYNPINIDGSSFEFDKHNNVVLSINKSIIKLNDNNEYAINQAVAVEGLPTYQMKPQTVFLINLMNTNLNNKIYRKWLNEVYANNKNILLESNFKFVSNIMALTDNYEQENNQFIESTYTYVTGRIANNEQLSNSFNGKIIGLNNLDLNKPVDQQSVKLFDSNNNYLNDLLKNVLDDNTYPLVINEVVAKIYGLNVGDKVYINPNNYFDRYIDKANGKVNTNVYPFTVVGITTSKSEQQMYTNQAFANEMLGYNDEDALKTYQGIKDSFGNDFVPFNGLYTNNPNSPSINNLASVYSITGLCPINSYIKRIFSNAVLGDDSTYTLSVNKDKLNNIFKFDFNSMCKNDWEISNIIIDIFGSPTQNSMNLIAPAISNVDVSLASQVIGQTIDSTIWNVEIILIMALLPTLLIIICLMATMIVSESRRLIAIMKVLGIGDWKNTFNFLFIYFVVLFFGLIIALPLTYGILSLFSQLSFLFFNIIINPVAPWWIYLATIGCLGIIFAIMFNIVRLKMSRINLSQAIGFEN